VTDPDLTAAENAAIRELAARLRPVTTLRDPDHAAADYVAWLRQAGWRPPLPAQPAIPPTGRRDPEVTRRGVRAAREALRQAKEAIDGITPKET
jgi:hypothetical protein